MPAKPEKSDKDTKDKSGKDAKLTPDDPRNRFVEDGEGMTINGMPIEEYLKHPDTQKALKNAAAKPGE